MKIDDSHVDAAIDAYDWVRANTFARSPVGHAVMEHLSPGAMRTLCGHILGTREGEVIQRCGTCLNVIYAKLGVRGVAT